VGDLTDAELDAIDARARAARTDEFRYGFESDAMRAHELGGSLIFVPGDMLGPSAAFVLYAERDTLRLVAEARDARACERAAMDARAVIAAERDRLARENKALRADLDAMTRSRDAHEKARRAAESKMERADYELGVLRQLP
jgi:hypothetical protein